MFNRITGIAFLAVMLAFSLDLVHFIGFHLHFFKHHPGHCKNLQNLDFGSEDFQITSDGLIFISSGLAFQFSPQSYWNLLERNNIKGRMLLLDLRFPDSAVKELKIRPSGDLNLKKFRPHGVSILEDKQKGEHLIYVVNHVTGELDCVEKFMYLPMSEELKHIQTFSSDLMHTTNDLAVIGDNKFYVTNTAYFVNSILGSFEQLLRLSFGDVLYFNGTDFTISVNGLTGPNGITLSKDGKHVYVAVFLSKGIRVYERSLDNSLKLAQEVYLGTSVDNLHLSEDGNILYSGNTPMLVKLAENGMDPINNKAPSQILRFPLKNGLIVEDAITELFYDHGDLISAASVGAVYNKKLYIGSIIDKFVICDLPEEMGY